jgi:hypothetical protein
MLGLAGCDAVNMKDLKPGVSTGYDVRDKLGKPGIEWRNDDGSVTWEYTRQPEGTECFMATIGPDNILKSLENVLTPQNFARVQPGWTRDQVRRLLGKPRSVQVFAMKKEEVWDWRLPPNSAPKCSSTSTSTRRAGQHHQPHGPAAALIQGTVPRRTGEKPSSRRLRGR